MLARADLGAIASALMRDYPDTNEGIGITALRASDVRLHPEIDGILAELREADGEFEGNARLITSRAPYALAANHELVTATQKRSVGAGQGIELSPNGEAFVVAINRQSESETR